MRHKLHLVPSSPFQLVRCAWLGMRWGVFTMASDLHADMKCAVKLDFEKAKQVEEILVADMILIQI